MCGYGYQVATGKLAFYFGSDLIHRLLHVPSIGEGAAEHYADSYQECLDLAVSDPSQAVRNSHSLQYFALDVYAYDIALPGEGCTGRPSEDEEEDEEEEEEEGGSPEPDPQPQPIGRATRSSLAKLEAERLAAEAAAAGAGAGAAGDEDTAISEPIRELVRRCLKVEPAERPDIDELIDMVEKVIDELPGDDAQ